MERWILVHWSLNCPERVEDHIVGNPFLCCLYWHLKICFKQRNHQCFLCSSPFNSCVGFCVLVKIWLLKCCICIFFKQMHFRSLLVTIESKGAASLCPPVFSHLMKLILRQTIPIWRLAPMAETHQSPMWGIPDHSCDITNGRHWELELFASSF